MRKDVEKLEIGTMTEEQYKIIVENCMEQSRKVRDGYYTKKAIMKAIDIINEMRQ